MSYRLQERVQKQLAAQLDFMYRTVTDAEAFPDQGVADVLWEHYYALRRLEELLRGRRVPQISASATVRN